MATKMLPITLDAHMLESAPITSYGTESTVLCGPAGRGGTVYQCVLACDMAGEFVNPVFSSAKLRLYITDPASTFSLINVDRCAEVWAESCTWAYRIGAPVNIAWSTEGGTPAGDMSAQVSGMPSTGWWEWDIFASHAADAWANRGGLLSLVLWLTGVAPNRFEFDAREGANPPEIVFTYEEAQLGASRGVLRGANRGVLRGMA